MNAALETDCYKLTDIHKTQDKFIAFCSPFNDMYPYRPMIEFEYFSRTPLPGPKYEAVCKRQLSY